MPIRVLVVDDSALMRQLLSEVLGRLPDIEVAGTASDPYVAREKIKALHPDVLTLDLEMPRMDGLTFLERLMALHPMPVVVLSSFSSRAADTALQALRLGAVDCVAKPGGDIRNGLAALQADLAAKIRSAAAARIGLAPERRPRPTALPRQPVSVAATGASTAVAATGASNVIIAIGASTGGVEALHAVLTALPPDMPPILVTQHMPAGFTTSFARRLNDECALSVTEAKDRQPVRPGHVYLANGAFHLELVRSGLELACRLHDGPPVGGHRPSVDVLFRSVARAAGSRAVGVILTGMGRDGADGLLAMRRAGARTIGQDEASCIVYGMPCAARAAGAVELELPLQRIPQGIVDAASALVEAVP
ncbi:protein-glutamate methylesterase/protein-glutamine glutaminase [Rhodopila globiformis]|uniref:Protein-glutamate methylesterase/protein-glutamine glutaminase n=1 Tax=Rhodopila globiformis TaxID=1071 RepID=A0A2S6NFM2_RHOGL|nr:chemotaxis response regulator protein-glutamate methylesterase [Rhodopila globiformis]PPQ33403.1 chemotaxis response regulator protein-glutamate methylesterase [Rhodopila globiformis]